MKYIIGNWKANKDFSQTKQWTDKFLTFDFSGLTDKLRIIICPPYPFIPYLFEQTKDISVIKIGSQDLSVYYEGAYTGEVPAKSLLGITKYAIIGHSERRHYFSESQHVLNNKVHQAFAHHIEPIFCVRGNDDPIPDGTKIIAYEPTSAIGTGENESVATILDVKQTLKLNSHHLFIYGGSVNEKNAHLF